MRALKIIALIVGAAIMVIGAAVDTTVSGGMYGQRVHNLALAQQQNVLLIIGGIIFLAGVLIRRNRDRAEPGSTRKCPYCAEEINVAAIKCKHCGEAVTPQPLAAQSAPAPDPYAVQAEQLGAVRAGRYWAFQGRHFACAEDVVEFAGTRRA